MKTLAALLALGVTLSSQRVLGDGGANAGGVIVYPADAAADVTG